MRNLMKRKENCMKVLIKKSIILLFSAVALTSCQWDTVTIRHNFFEERFNLEQLYDLTNKVAFEDAGYFNVSSKQTYIQMHVPEITNEEPAPTLGAFEFNYQRISHPLIESKGTYYGTGIPHSDTGTYVFTITESTSTRMIGEYTLELVNYYRLEIIINSFVLDDGTTIQLKFDFRSARWGG